MIVRKIHSPDIASNTMLGDEPSVKAYVLDCIQKATFLDRGRSSFISWVSVDKLTVGIVRLSRAVCNQKILKVLFFKILRFASYTLIRRKQLIFTRNKLLENLAKVNG